MDKKRILKVFVTAAVVLAVMFAGVLLAVLMSSPGRDHKMHTNRPARVETTELTQSTESATEPSSEPATEPVTEPSTEPPAEPSTEPPTTGPTFYPSNGDELIGKLYTRDQLAAINGTRKTYGTGTITDGIRPSVAIKNEKTYGQLYDAHFIGPDQETIYFTFAHGYEQDNLTGIVLDTLKEKNIKGIFFINKGYARFAPDMVWRMINEGHIVANHATNHPDMGTLSVDEMVTEIMTMHNYMVEHFGYEMQYFRPPSGYYSERLLAVAQSLGYTTVQWSYTYRDWDRSAPPDYHKFRDSIVESAHNGAIYYFHTVTPGGVSAICDSIDALREKGYAFVPLTSNTE